MTDHSAYTSNGAAPRDYDESVIDKIAKLREDTADLVKSLPNLSSEIKDAFRSLEQRISDLYETAAEDAEQGVASAGDIIMERPWASIGIAFGAGLIAALFLGRR